MNNVIKGFSLSQILRQFCCGIVFFLPIFLFRYDLRQVLLGQSNGQATDGILAIVAVVCFIIGTLIYHLEKNLYSYAVQYVFYFFSKFKGKFAIVGRLLHIIILIGIIICAGLGFIHYEEFPIRLLIIVASLIALILVILVTSSAFSETVRSIWKVESCHCCLGNGAKPGADKEDSCQTRGEITENLQIEATRISSWSDYIHCAQTCAFAWLLGSLVCRYAFPPTGCCVSECKYFLSNIHEFYMCIRGALILLLVELFIDWHRYQHVIYILNHYKKS